VALVLAVIVFLVLKLLGLVLHIALVVAAVGFVAGLIIARTFRRS
jgi:multisubunit Na+/H+ antiporter MnhF subunit